MLLVRVVVVFLSERKDALFFFKTRCRELMNFVITWTIKLKNVIFTTSRLVLTSIGAPDRKTSCPFPVKLVENERDVLNISLLLHLELILALQSHDDLGDDLDVVAVAIVGTL